MAMQIPITENNEETQQKESYADTVRGKHSMTKTVFPKPPFTIVLGGQPIIQ